MKKHILVISQYFYPEQFRINDICSEWIKRGYKVTVVTGIPNYPQGKFYPGYGLFKKRKEIFHGIEIIRIPILSRGKSSLRLALNYLSFVISGFFWSHLTRIKADAVFIFEVSPMTQALPGVWFAKRRKAPCYLYVQDLWPENVEIITGLKNRKILSMIGKMVDYIYRRCTKILTTSESFVAAIANRGVPRDRIEYWPQYAEDFYQPVERTVLEEIPLDGIFNIIFAGNIGTAQGLDILPKTAKIMKEQNVKVRFNIVGDGRYKNDFIQIVKESSLESYFNFVDRQPAERVPALLAANDAAFLSLTAGLLFAMTIPAKLQSYLACGIPVIASADGETKSIIESSQSGLCSPAGDAEELALNIARLVSLSSSELNRMAANALNYYQQNFEKKILMDKMDQYFDITNKMEMKSDV